MGERPKKHIKVSERNYHILRRLGNITDSFDDVVTQLLEQRLQVVQSLPTQDYVAESETPNAGDPIG